MTVFDPRGIAFPHVGETVALMVQAVVEVDPRANRACPDCQPHGHKGRICFLWSWVDCELCVEHEKWLALDDLGNRLTAARGRRRFDPECPSEVDAERIGPGRWRVQAKVARLLDPVDEG